MNPPKCMRCLDRGLYWSEWSCAQVYCDCTAGKDAEEVGCLSDEDAGPQPNDFGDQP